MIQGLHHIALISSSEESVRFYKLLGFHEYFRKPREKDTVVLLKGHGIQLEIFVDPNHPKFDQEPIGFRHISLHVNSIEETIDELGIESGPIMSDWIGLRFCFIKDPDGLTIELHE